LPIPLERRSLSNGGWAAQDLFRLHGLFTVNPENDMVRGLAELLKLPMRALLSSMEAAAATMRQAQRLYDATLDAAAQGIAGRAVAPGDGVPQQAAGTAVAQELVRETLDGLVAFVVPGPDAYSVAQGESTAEPGGIAAGITEALITAFDLAQPAPPQGPPSSAAVAGLLNQVARQVSPAASGGFASPFANLSFAGKAAVFRFLEEDPAMAQFRRLAGLLLFAPAALAYSEFGAVDCRTGGLTGRPVGWAISGYDGVAEGHDDFKGYFQDRREPERSTYADEDLIQGRSRRA
jgi:hypothetical protein